jgi:hypothetical protein
MPNVTYPSESLQYISPVLRSSGVTVAWPTGTQFAFYNSYTRPQTDVGVDTTFTASVLDGSGKTAVLKPIGMLVGTWYLWGRFHNGSEYVYIKSTAIQIV